MIHTVQRAESVPFKDRLADPSGKYREQMSGVQFEHVTLWDMNYVKSRVDLVIINV